MRLYESAITSRVVLARKIGRLATFDFYNKIGTKLPIEDVRYSVAIEVTTDMPLQREIGR
jgi:hypothetical protein